MPNYILITSSRDEEKYIENTIKAVIDQTVTPLLWVIVSDRSSDRTDDIIKAYAERYDFIRYKRIDEEDIHSRTEQAPGATRDGRSSFGKPVAINRVYDEVKDMPFEYFGVLDADITVPPGYYEKMMHEMAADPTIGMIGGSVYNKVGDKTWPMFINAVGGPIQFFTRTAWEHAGKYDEILYGEDTVMARKIVMKGYKNAAVHDPSFRAYHHKPASIAGRSIYRAKLHVGRMQYLLGDSCWYFVLKSIRNVTRKPFLVGSMLSLIGYFGAMLKGEKRLISDEMYVFHKRHQRDKFLKAFKLR